MASQRRTSTTTTIMDKATLMCMIGSEMQTEGQFAYQGGPSIQPLIEESARTGKGIYPSGV
jgi:hypothetical protein